MRRGCLPTLSRLFPPALLGLALLLGGCESAVETGLSEEAANAVVVALHESSIGARKEEQPGGEEPQFTVLVPQDDVATALQVLRAAQLPRQSTPGFAELYGEPGLVPTANEEKARYSAALAGELSQSLETIDGVLRARVHLALPERRVLALDAPEPRPRASVLITYEGPSKPYEDESVQALVAGAVDGMAEDQVAVVGVLSVPPESAQVSLTRVGPFAVSRGSATPLKLALGGALVLHALLAALVGALLFRRKRLPEVAIPPGTEGA